jgi:hypothetical protein
MNRTERKHKAEKNDERHTRGEERLESGRVNKLGEVPHTVGKNLVRPNRRKGSYDPHTEVNRFP